MYQIKVNIPESRADYETGNGEGCFFLVDERTKAAYDNDETGDGFSGVLNNDTWAYPELKHGQVLPIEMRGSLAPVVPFEALRPWMEGGKE